MTLYRGSEKGPRVAAAKKKPGKSGAPKTPVQTLQQWADAQAQKVVNAQIAAIEERQRAYFASLQEQAAQRAQAARNFAAMVQGLGIDKTIQGTYRTAGSDLAGLAQGFAGGTRDIAAADAAAQMNMLSGTGQEGAVRDQGVNMGDVAYGVGGYIPAKSLGEQGAAFAADAAAQPGFMLQNALLESQRALQQGMADNPYLDEIMKARLQKTELSQAFAEQKQAAALQAQKMRLDQLESDRNYWLKQKATYLAERKFGLAKQADARAQAAEKRYRMEAMGRAPDGSPLPGFYIDNQGRVVQKGWRFNARGELVEIPSAGAAKGGKGGGLTANAKADAMNRILAKEADIAEVLPAVAKQQGWQYDLVGPPSPATKAARAKTAKALFERFKPFAQTPAARKQLRKMIALAMSDLETGIKTGTGKDTGGGLTGGLIPAPGSGAG